MKGDLVGGEETRGQEVKREGKSKWYFRENYITVTNWGYNTTRVSRFNKFFVFISYCLYC